MKLENKVASVFNLAVLLFIVLGAFSLWRGKTSAPGMSYSLEPTPVPAAPLTINATAMRCDMHYALVKSGWVPISSDVEKRAVSENKRYRLRPMPTLTCVDESSCDKKPPGCALKTFMAIQWWYEEVKLPARRLTVND